MADDPRRSSVDDLLAELEVGSASEGARREGVAHHASLTTMLAGLADRRASVAVHTSGGRTHRGELFGVGVDFVALRAPGGPPRLVALHAIATIEPSRDDSGEAAGARHVDVTTKLVEVLAAGGADRRRVQVAMGRELLTADLEAVGTDFVTLRRDDPPALLYLPLGSLSEVSLLESG